MKQRTIPSVVWWLVLGLLALTLGIMRCDDVGAGTVTQRETFQAPGWHQARVQVLWDSSGTWVESSDTTVDLPSTLDLSLLDTRDQQVRTTWYDTLSDDSVGTWETFLYRRGPAATTRYPLWLVSSDYDSVWIEVADRVSTDSLYVAVDTGVVTLPQDTTVTLRTSRDNRITMRWFEKVTGDTASSTEWLLYQTLDAPAAATGDFVRLYYDVTGGIVSGDIMQPRDAIEFTLTLVSGPGTATSGWGIVPQEIRAKPVAGRVTFDVVPTDHITPAGCYYVLTYVGKRGRYPVSGEVYRFYVDSLPDPVNVLNCKEAW